MLISHSYKFIFIKTRKTAGTSIELFLSQFCDENDSITPLAINNPRSRNYNGIFNPVPEFFIQAKSIMNLQNTHYWLYSSNPLKDFLKKRKFYNHIPAYILKQRISNSNWTQYYKFCFERNPWDKTLSHYYFMKELKGFNLSFEDYLNSKKLAWNYPLYTNPFNHHEVIVDYIGKYENINEDLNHIFKTIGIPFSGSLGVNAYGNFRSDKRPYQEALSSKHYDFIAKQFSHEIRLNNY